MENKQIVDYIHHEVDVYLEDGKKITGTLRFFNFQDQVVHLSEWKSDIDNGEFIVINKQEWRSINMRY